MFLHVIENRPDEEVIDIIDGKSAMKPERLGTKDGDLPTYLFADVQKACVLSK